MGTFNVGPLPLLNNILIGNIFIENTFLTLSTCRNNSGSASVEQKQERDQERRGTD